MLSSRAARLPIRSLHIPSPSSRQYSSFQRNINSRALSSTITASRQSILRTRSSPFAALKYPLALRFNSTSATPQATAPETFPDLLDSSNASPGLFEQLAEVGPLDPTPHVGMLKEAGVDFGWGSTSMIQWLAEHIYVFSDMPWWVTLIVTPLIIRGAMFYPMILSNNEMTKFAIIGPEMTEIKKRYEKMEIDPARKMQFQQAEVNLLQKKVHLSFQKLGIPFIVQMIVGFSSFRFFRNLGLTNGVGLEHGGLLWLTNLQIPDPYYGIPIAIGLTMHVVGRLGGELGTTPLNPVMKNALLYFLPVALAAFLAFQPACLQIPMVILSICSIVQTRAFRWSAFRRWAGMIRLPKPQLPAASKTKPGVAAQQAAPDNFVSTMMDSLQTSMGMEKKKPSRLAKTRGEKYLKKVEKYEKKTKGRQSGEV